MMYLRQATSVDVPIGPFLDETDGKTAETALTITQPDIRLKKNGGAWAQKAAAQTLSHEEAGWYEVTLDATDTDTCGHLVVAIHESGALPVWREFTVLEEAIYDALFAASAPGYLQPTVSGRTLDVTATGAAGIDWANVEGQNTLVSLIQTDISAVQSVASISGNAINANAIAADAGTEIGTAVWASATRTLTAATNITSTGGTTVPQTGDSFARLGAPAGASIAADIAAIAADNPNRPTRGVQLDNLTFTMVDATDFNTPETGITVTAQISKDGGAFAACTNAVSEISAGFYKITLTATEMTADSIALKFTGAGCAQRNFAFRTQPT